MLRLLDRGWWLAACLAVSLSASGCAEPIPANATGRKNSGRLDGKPVEIANAVLELPAELKGRFPYATAPFAGFEAGIKRELPLQIEIVNTSNESNLPDTVKAALRRPQAYWISIEPSRIRVMGSDMQATLYAMADLSKLAVQHEGIVPTGAVLDWPDHERRALHIVLKTVTVPIAKRLIDMARDARMNTIILSLADAVRFDSRATLPRRDALSKQQLVDIVSYARRSGLEVIPEITLLTHQENFFKKSHPLLMYNAVTYDPRREDTYRLVFEYLGEVITLLDSKIIHIGHDEVQGMTKWSRKQWLNEGDKPLPPELFLYDVNRLYEYLSAKNIGVWMWGDMLISPEEFPGMRPNNQHGIGGYAGLRGKAPPEITICDWHYSGREREFPSAEAFVLSGHKVLGATWKDNNTTERFSRYMKRLAPAGQGMIATTWFHVQKREWDVVSEIIRHSGEVFWSSD